MATVGSTIAMPRPVASALSKMQRGGAEIDLSSSESLASSPELWERVAAELSQPRVDKLEVAATVAWILVFVVDVAVRTRAGSLLVQTLLEIADTGRQFELVKALVKQTIPLTLSENGFYVLEKAIEEMPCEHFRPIIRAIIDYGPVQFAKLQFGCRIIERLMAFSTETYLCHLNSLLVESTVELCRDRHGHFVVLALFEHYPSCHDGMVARMLAELPHLAKHERGSHVVGTALRYGGDRHRVAMVSALLNAEAPDSIEELAASHHGAVVIEELFGPFCSGASELVCEVQRRLATAGPEQRTSFSQVALALALQAEPPAQSPEPGNAKAC